MFFNGSDTLFGTVSIFRIVFSWNMCFMFVKKQASPNGGLLFSLFSLQR
jgi:hypothetical protein